MVLYLYLASSRRSWSHTGQSDASRTAYGLFYRRKIFGHLILCNNGFRGIWKIGGNVRGREKKEEKNVCEWDRNARREKERKLRRQRTRERGREGEENREEEREKERERQIDRERDIEIEREIERWREREKVGQIGSVRDRKRKREIAGWEGRRERRRVVSTLWIPGQPEFFYGFLCIFRYVCPPHAHVRTDVSSPSAQRCSTLHDL